MAEIDKPYLYKDLTTLTCWAKWLLRASLAVSVISVISGIMEYRLLQAIAAGQFDSDAEMTAAARANDLRQGISGIAYIVLLLATSVVVLVWIYGANHNAHALGATGMRFTSGWAVGWYFIPIFNLWKPYQAMKEIWKASADPRNWQSHRDLRSFRGGGSSGSPAASSPMPCSATRSRPKSSTSSSMRRESRSHPMRSTFL